MHAGRWQPAAYHRIDPRWLVWGDDGETPLLVYAQDGRAAGPVTQPIPVRGPAGTSPAWGTQASPLEPREKWIYHAHHAKSGLATRGGLAYAVATIWLLKSIAVRDWWAFSEVFGLPVRVGKYGPNATEGDIQTLVDAVNALRQRRRLRNPRLDDDRLHAGGRGAWVRPGDLRVSSGVV